MKRKKREFEASELMQSFARIYGFEDKILAFEVRKFLKEYLDESLYSEIGNITYSKKILSIRIQSPLLKNDFRMRKSFYLQKFQSEFGEEKFTDLIIL